MARARLYPAAAGVVVCCTVAQTAPAQSSQTLRPVAISGQTQSSGGRIGEISSQTINNSGQVAIRASYEDPAVPFGAIGAFVAGGNPAQQPQLVGGDGRPAPGTGGASFGGASQPPLNQRGEIAFLTTLQGGDVEQFGLNATALYVGTPQAQQLVAREGGQVPDAEPGVVYARSSSGGPFGGVLLNHAGQVGYVARLSGGPGTASYGGLFAGAPGAVRMISRANDPSPVPGMNFAGAYTRPGVYPSLGPVMNDGGQVLFRDNLGGAASGNLTTGEGLFFGSSRDSLTTVLKSGDAAPGAPAGTRVLAAATTLALNNRGQVAFGSELATPEGAGATALYHGTAGNLRPVFLSGDAAPGTTAGVTLSQLYHGETVVMNANGKVAFQAHLEGGDAIGSFRDRALYTGTPGDLDLIARLGDRAPGTPDNVVFRTIYGVAMNAPGQAAFHAMLGDSATGDNIGYGLFGYDPAAGVHLIAKTGDTFDLGDGQTRTIRAFAFNAESGGQDGRLISVNDLGQVAFTMGFAEGGSGGAIGEERRGLFLASIVPEPSAAVLVLGMGAVGLMRRRRR